MKELVYYSAILLGVVTPLLALLTLRYGIGKSSLESDQKNRAGRIAFTGIVTWTALTWLLALTGIYQYHAGDVIPRFVVGLVLPVIIGVLLLTRPIFREIVDSIGTRVLVGMQGFRLFGASFLLVPVLGFGPDDFTSAGVGDLITGLLALSSFGLYSASKKFGVLSAWLFTAAGMFDLLNVSRILLTYYPSWYNEGVSTAASTEFPSVLILLLAAPIALVFHVYAIRSLIRGI